MTEPEHIEEGFAPFDNEADLCDFIIKVLDCQSYSGNQGDTLRKMKFTRATAHVMDWKASL